MNHAIALLADAPSDAVEALLDEAFGVDRHARTAYRIREGTVAMPDLSFAVFDGEQLVGSLQSWPVELALTDAPAVPLVLVGPVAVTPRLQGGGLGTALMDRLVSAASGQPMAMIGDAAYYARWGFSSVPTAGWTVPGPVERHRLLARTAEALPKFGALGPRGFALARAAE